MFEVADVVDERVAQVAGAVFDKSVKAKSCEKFRGKHVWYMF